MEQSHDPARDSLALARQHVRALTDGGLSREALLRALLEQEEGSNNLAPLPSQALPTQMQSQPQLIKSSPLSRTMSLSQSTSKSHWSISASGHELEEGDRPSSSDQLSTSTGHSGSRTSYLSTNTTATSLSSRSSTITQFPGPELQGSRPTSTSTRAYWCTSCDTEFKRKFDWKRHEDEFHERYKKYPCPDCNRVFWGANTFNQHHKTRHNCKTCPHADKVIKYTRKKRAWACGFCAAFLPSMDRYIDHIGLHYESGRTRAHWFHSNVIYGLLHQPGINPAWRDIIDSKFSHIPKDQQPRYGWDPKTTGRKQGFLENETAGNLQDLLEFFNPTKDDPAKVARMAFDFAELTPAHQAPGRSSLEVPDKSVPPPPPPAPKREKSTASSKRKPSGGIHKNSAPQELPLPPLLKERPLTRWPGLQQPEIPEMPSTEPLPGRDSDVHMSDYDATAIPQPLFAGTLSPPPHPPFQPHTAPTISISRSSDQPSFLAPPTPLPSTPSTPFPGSAMPRDTVVDLLSDYMSPAQLQGLAGSEVQQQQQPPHVPQGMSGHSPFGTYEDWNSICSTMVEDISSPAHAGPPLPLAPHERPQQAVRRSDFWAPQGDGPEAMYMEGLQRCDLGSLPPPSIHEQSIGRRSDVWASSGAVDYEGMGYDEEIAPPPPSTNWL